MRQQMTAILPCNDLDAAQRFFERLEPASFPEYRMMADGHGGFAIGPPEDKAWGMYEFALNGPDETLVRVGWPTRHRAPAASQG
jgi:hypothetical protein